MFLLINFVLLSCVLLASNSATVNASSACPSRDLLYPCYCTSIPLTKRRSFMLVTCSLVQKTSTLQRIYRTLPSLEIDRLILLDAFWGAAEKDSVLPHNWMSLLKIKELEIIDSQLSPDFACDISEGCQNAMLTRLTVRNSTSGETINPVCEKGSVSMYWTSCLSHLQHLSFTHNKLISFDKNVFPTTMPELLTLDLSYNQISTVGPSAFGNLPKLTSLDLSNNQIKVVGNLGIFGKEPNVLTHLDLSWNNINNLSPDIFKQTPFLVSFSIRGNHLTALPEEHWEHLAKTIKHIDLQDNFIRCDCHLVWMNCTLKVHTNVLGYCANSYENTPLRRVSKYMSERCTEDGVLEERVNQTKGNACVGWWKKTGSKSDVNNSLHPRDIIQLPLSDKPSSGKKRKRN